MRLLLSTIGLFQALMLVSQPQFDNLKYEDETYLDYIKTVKLSHQGLNTSVPIFDLNSSAALMLSFDDLEAGDKTYRYRLIHCDKNWNPTEMDEQDYIDGFQDEEIEDVYYSSGTLVDYTHYRLSLPNQDLRWTVSGNYVLVVYEDEYDPTLAITRRFMVAEKLVSVFSEVRRPIDVLKLKTHHELSFGINAKKFNMSNPLNEVEVVIMQNGKWSDAITELKPKFINGDNLEFRYTDKLIFPALKEFRFADLRSTRTRSRGVHTIEATPNVINVLMELEEPRTYMNFLSESDINGSFIIETVDDDNDHEEAEYLNVIFTLDMPTPLFEKDIYLFGAFTDWRLKPEYKMTYDYQRKIYIAEAFMKQGYYNYMYVTEADQGGPDYSLEGSWYETENDYTIIVYYTEFGSRYDRIIGIQAFNSNF